MMEKKQFASQKAEIDFADGEVPLPPNIRPVIVMSGSDYDMGYQYYQQLIQIFGPWILAEIPYHTSDKDELKILKDYEPHIKQHTPEMIDMFKGMAAGATDAGVPLSYEEVLVHFSRERRARIESAIDCSGFAGWGSCTKDGRLIGASSTDHALMFEVTLAVFPDEGNNFILSPFWATEFGELGGHPGMNNKGLAYVHHGATHWVKGKPKAEWTDGIKEGIANIHTLRFAQNAAEARDMQLAYPSGDGFAGGLWADIQGSAYDIECRENPRVIRQAGDYGEVDFLYSTNNAISKELGHCQDPPPEGNVYIPHGGWLGTGATISSVPRNLEIWNMLHNYHGKIDVDFVKMIWRFVSQPPFYPTLEEADAAYYKTKGEGWDQKIGSLFNALTAIVLPDDGDEGLYYLCGGRAARVGYPHLPGGHYYPIAPPHSFYELKLASGPEAFTQAARDRAQYGLYYADQELRKLNYPDAAYAPLDAIFNQAATEWYKGRYYHDPVILGKTSGNETIYKCGKAVRAFTRCQAFARQVYNVLIPPATKPEDLGHLPWEYWTKKKIKK